MMSLIREEKLLVNFICNSCILHSALPWITKQIYVLLLPFIVKIHNYCDWWSLTKKSRSYIDIALNLSILSISCINRISWEVVWCVINFWNIFWSRAMKCFTWKKIRGKLYRMTNKHLACITKIVICDDNFVNFLRGLYTL